MLQKRILLVKENANGVLLLDRASGKKLAITNTQKVGKVHASIQERVPLCEELQHELKDAGLDGTHRPFQIQDSEVKLSEKARVFPLRAYVGINNICNINCRVCYARKDMPDSPIQLSREEWTPILNVLERHGLVEIRIGESGEPTLNARVLTQFLLDAKERGFYISLTTNGQFENKWVTEWANLVDQPIFSIDGSKEFHDWNRGEGTFDRSVENLKLFSGKTKELRVNTVFSRDSLRGLENLIKICEDKGVTELCLLQLRPYNKGRLYWDQILTPKEWHTFITETVPMLRVRYPGLRIRPDYDISGETISDRLVDKIFQCSAGMDAFGLRPIIQDGIRKVKIYGCGYLCDEGEEFIAGLLSPDEFETLFLSLWHDDKKWNVFRNPKRNDECISKCDHHGKTCFGQCTAMLRYAELNPEFSKYLKCAFSREPKLT